MSRMPAAPPSINELLSAEMTTRPLPYPRDSRPLHALLAAPAPYTVGMGGLSLQSVWESLLATDQVSCERAFSDFPDGKALLPQARFGGYNLVGFSVPYELDWLAIPAMLAAGGLAVWSRDRGEDAPLVVAGGASVTMNPEPLAEVIDAFVIGEFEPLAEGLVDSLLQADSRSAALEALAALPGVYVPSLPPERPVSRLVWDGAEATPRSSLVLTEHSAFPGRFLVEAGRGCPMGCGFCLASAAYRPVRYARRAALLRVAGEGLRFTNRIGLIGAALSGYPDLEGVLTRLVDADAEVSLSSLRADLATPSLLAALHRGGQRSITIAPEAATERLRLSIGKRLTDEAIHRAILSASEAGISDIKLYFMTNLPGELAEDTLGVAGMVEDLCGDFPGLRFAVTLSPFVPKPWTRLAQEAFPPVREVRSRLERTGGDIRRRTNAEVRPGSARWAAVQAALARGDRNVGRAIVASAEEGGGYSSLKRALKAEDVNLDAEQAAPAEPPWLRALDIDDTCSPPSGGGESDA